MGEWRQRAREAAADAAEHFLDEIVEGMLDDGKMADNISAYSQHYHFERVVDRTYGPIEAVNLMEDLEDHEETDSGIWQGADWRGILQAKAAWTFGHAVNAFFEEIAEKVNTDEEIGEMAILREATVKARVKAILDEFRKEE